MIRWMFFLENRELAIDTEDLEEDKRIAEALHRPHALLSLKSNNVDCFINLQQIRLISRSIVDETKSEVSQVQKADNTQEEKKETVEASLG